MQHRLQNRIDTVRRKAWLQALLWGVCVAVSGAVLLIAAGTALDFVFRFEDIGLRTLLTGALLIGIGWLCWRFPYRRFVSSVSPQTIAERLERQHPQLRGELTSALEFLDQPEDDPRAGSSVLRRAVISRTEAAAEDIAFTSVLRKRPFVQALATVFVLLLGAGAFCVWQPQAARTALVRLGNPLSKVAWPRASYLQWKDRITHVPRGGTFEVEIFDARGKALPEDVELQIRYRGQEDDIESLPMRFVGESMRIRREGVVRPFEYRAIGGDDNSMSWSSLEVIEPPEVQSLALELHPPAYTNWPVRESSGRVEALVGTYVALQGTSTKKLRSAEVVLGDETRVAAKIGADGYSFSVPAPAIEPDANIAATDGTTNSQSQFTSQLDAAADSTASDANSPYFIVRTSGVYSLQLVDESGYATVDQTQYEIRAIADDPPRANIDQPTGDLVATPDARMPISLTAADDLHLRDVELRYSRSDKSEDGNLVIPLFKRTDPLPVVNEWPAWTAPDETREIQYAWELRDLRLPPGSRVTFYALASDFSGQVGQSPSRRLTIVTPEQLQDRLSEEQAFVVDELARVLETQVAARGQLSQIQLQLRDVGRLKPDDIDTLQSAELTQSNVDRALLDEAAGVRGRVSRLLEMIDNNRLNTPDVTRRMQGILDAVAAMSADELPAISAALTAAIKDAHMEAAANQPDPVLQKNVQAAAANQDQVIRELESVLGELSQWNNYRRFFRDVGRIRQDQAEIAQDVADLMAALLGKQPDQLSAQEQADLAKLQSRHDDLARRLETLQGQMQPMIDSLREDDPLAADILADALDLAQRQAIGQKMRQAGNEVQQNRLASALRSHEQVGEALQEMLDVLSNKREHELARLAKKLDQASQELRDLQERQAGLRKQMQAAAANPNPEERRRELERLAEEQRKLQEEADRLTRQLQRLQSQSASQSSSSAARQMASAADSAAGGDQQQADEAIDRAQKDLEDAQQQIQQQQEQIQRDLAEELVAKTIDSLRGLRDRQLSLLDESNRLTEMRQSQSGSLSRGQLMSVRDLARDQDLLGEETSTLAHRLEPVPAFAAALASAADQMELAVILLGQQDEAAAILRQQDALRRLDQLLLALQPPAPQSSAEQQPDGQSSGSQPQNSGDGIPRLAQLRLLKMLQEALNLETGDLDTELQASRQAGIPLTDAQQRRFEALSIEQGRLADLILEMSRPVDDDPLKDLQPSPENNQRPGGGGP